MGIPSFDEHGLLPVGIHDCTLADMEAAFAWNSHRRGLYRKFAACFKEELRPRFDAPVCVDGSFVTRVESPNDVDVVIDLTQETPDEQRKGLAVWLRQRKRLMERYDVDLWPNVPGRQDMIAYFQGLKAQTARFLGLREDHRKGLVRVR